MNKRKHVVQDSEYVTLLPNTEMTSALKFLSSEENERERERKRERGDQFSE